jgi:hypothetical protein
LGAIKELAARSNRFWRFRTAFGAWKPALELQYRAFVGVGTSWVADDSLGTIELTFANGLPLELPEDDVVLPALP